MGIGYNHAARLIDILEERGIIGPVKPAGPRDILIDLDAPIETYISPMSNTPEEQISTEETFEEINAPSETDEFNENGGNI